MLLASSGAFGLSSLPSGGLRNSPVTSHVYAARGYDAQPLPPAFGQKKTSLASSVMASVNEGRATSASTVTTVTSPSALVPRGGLLSKLKNMDVPLLCYFLFWYIGNYYYNITNKMALRAAGGKTGFPMTVSSLQMGVGCLYAVLLWLVPDGREKPKLTMDDLIKIAPIAFCSMGSHCASVFAMNAGAVSFAQIVKAAEPAFSAVLAQFVYGKEISRAKWMCLPLTIGGVVLSSVKELDFAWMALGSACLANLFAAFKGNENKKLMTAPGLKDRMGSVGNLFAVTTIGAFLWSIPLMIAKEGAQFGQFVELYKASPALSFNLIASGMWWYGYNELATMTIKKTNAVTASVANTAKRVIVIVGCALVFGESLAPIKLVGCSIAIFGVMLYSIIDSLLAKRN
jgi:solute carrier family 35 protein E1